MTLYHEIEAECARTEDSPDTAENAKLGITFRAVWWRQIKQELANQAAEIARLRLFLAEIAGMGPADDEWDADTLEDAVALAKRGLAPQGE